MSDPLRPPSPPCTHKYVHLETARFTKDGTYNTTFVRIDRFFCEKCLYQREVRKEGAHRDTPDWYEGGDDNVRS